MTAGSPHLTSPESLALNKDLIHTDTLPNGRGAVAGGGFLVFDSGAAVNVSHISGAERGWRASVSV